MTHDAAGSIKALIAAILAPKLPVDLPPGGLQDSLDLRDEGIVDSLGFVQLLAELETRLDRSIDLTDLDPEELTNVGVLARHIAKQCFLP